MCCADESSSESECDSDGGSSSCSSSSDSEMFDVIAEIKRKKAHPDRLHEELWYNDPGQVRFTILLRNDGCFVQKAFLSYRYIKIKISKISKFWTL